MGDVTTFELLARQLKNQFEQKRLIDKELNATLFELAKLISASNIGTQLQFHIDDSGTVWTTEKLKDASPKSILDLICTDGPRVRTRLAVVDRSGVTALGILTTADRQVIASPLHTRPRALH
jgi:hypothetical protein